MCRSALSRGLAVSCHVPAAVQEHSTQAEQESEGVLLTVPAGQSIMQFVAAWEHLVSYFSPGLPNAFNPRAASVFE